MRRVNILFIVAVIIVSALIVLPLPIEARVLFALANAAMGVRIYKVLGRASGDNAARRIIADAEARRDNDERPR